MRIQTLLFTLLLLVSIVFGQAVKDGPPPATALQAETQKSTALPNIELTEIEKLKRENDQLKAERLNLSIGNLETQVTNERNKIFSDTALLNDELLKAHGLDPQRYQCVYAAAENQNVVVYANPAGCVPLVGNPATAQQPKVGTPMKRPAPITKPKTSK